MLPPAALVVADRLAATLMALVRAVGRVATTASTPTLPQAAAHTLLHRLTHLVIRLVHINNFGLPAPRERAPAASTQDEPPPVPVAPRRQPARQATRLPRHSGWLLDALPDVAPAVADDLRALLDDPATATLLAAAPTLERSLGPLLRGLGLDPAQLSPPPDPNPPDAPLPEPPRPNPSPCPAAPLSSRKLALLATTSKSPLSTIPLSHAHIIPLTQRKRCTNARPSTPPHPQRKLRPLGRRTPPCTTSSCATAA